MKNKNNFISRRNFLNKIGSGVAGTVIASTLVGCSTSSDNTVKTITMPESDYVSHTMLVMAKDIYPHDIVENKYYQKIVDDLANQEKN